MKRIRTLVVLFWMVMAMLCSWNSFTLAAWPPISENVDAWIDGSHVHVTVYDPEKGQWEKNDWSNVADADTIVNKQDGIVAWKGGSHVHVTVYDPEKTQWVKNDWPYVADADTIVNNQGGIVAWKGGSHVHVTVYDPEKTQWVKNDWPYVADADTIVNNQGGIVAWKGGSHVHVTVYDPEKTQWVKTDWPYVADSNTVVTIQDFTVFWTKGETHYTKGYNPSSGSWDNNPTRPLSYFYAGSSSGAPPLGVWFWDMSIGADSWSYTFGDGFGKFDRSPYHRYTGCGAYTATQAVSGPAGDATSSRTITTDSAGPTGSITINGDAAWTNLQTVTLSVSATDSCGSVQSMRFGSDGSNWGEWETYSTSKTLALPPGDGAAKLVYAQFKDGAGNLSSSCSDTIGLDTTAPTTGTLTATPGNGRVDLSWSAFADSLSGISQYKLVYLSGTTAPPCTGGTQLFTGTGTSYSHTGLTNGSPVSYSVCASDNAGNVSAPASRGATPGGGYTLTAAVDPAGGGTVTGTGFSCPGDCSETYATATSVTLTAAAGAGYKFNNWTGCSSTTDTTCTVTVDANKTVTAHFVATGSLAVTITPAAAVTAGAQWHVDAGAWKNSGATVSNLAVGSHTVGFKDVSGWTKPADQGVPITAGETSTITVNYTQQPGDLVAYYPFNGNANDESGNENHGEPRGGPVLTTDRFGNPDSAYSFDGVDDYFLANADPLPTHERTVALWFFAPDVDSHPNLLSYGGAGIVGQSWLMMINQTCNPGKFEMQGHGNVNRIDYAYPSPPVGKWHHWAVTTDSGKYSKIYINGEKVKELDSFEVDTVVQGKDLAIGVSVSPAGIAPYTDENVGYFKGKLDDIRIYNRALSDQEIKDLYVPGDLVAHYPFNGNTEDVSLNGNHGQNHGAVFAPDMVGTATSAIAFNGTAAYVEVPDSPSLRITGTVSLTAWAKRTRFDQVDFILEKGGDWTHGETNYGMGLNSDTYNDMFYFIYAGGWKGVRGPTDTSWHHYAVVAAHGDSDVALYIDGEPKTADLKGGAEIVNLKPSDANLHIGAQVEASDPYYGANVLDDVRIYNRALSDQEIKDLYAPGGLIAYYPFNGNAKDETGNGHDGTAHGAVLTADRFGNANSAYTFDGASAYITASDAGFPADAEARSVAAWIRTSYDTPQEITWYGNFTDYQGFYTTIDNSGVHCPADNPQPVSGYTFLAGWYGAGSGNIVNLCAPPVVTDGEWHHVAATYENPALVLYVDGERIVERQYTPDTAPQGLFYIGAFGNSAQGNLQNFFKGEIDDVRIYNRALSAEEILSLYSGVQLKLPKKEVGSPTFQVPITIESVTGLLAADLGVQFDPAVILATSVEKGAFAAEFAREYTISETGKVTISMASATPATGSGELAVIHFDAIGPSGSSSALTFSDVLLNDGAIVPGLVNGSVTLSSGHGISGKCRYYNGSATITGVKLKLAGEDNQTTYSDADGAYQFLDVAQGNWTLTPSESRAVGSAIGAADAVLVLKHKAGVGPPLSANQKKAADANCNGAITSMDASLILQKAVDLISLPFPGCKRVWLFTPTQRSYKPLEGDQTGQNFAGIVIGDVNGSWIQPQVLTVSADSGAQRSAAAAGRARVSPGKPVQTSGNEVTVPLRLTVGEGEIFSAVLELDYAGKFMKAVAVQLGPAAGKALVASNLKRSGKIRIALASAEPLTRSGRLFTIVFKAKQTLPAPLNCTIKNVSINDGEFQVGF